LSKILTSFPIYSNPEVIKPAIESLNCDKFFVINNPKLAYLAQDYPHIINKKNNYCNGAWNQAMEYFLQGDWDYLALGSSDVIMGRDWQNKIPTNPKEVFVPSYVEKLEWLNKPYELKGGVAGACTIFPREAIKMVYPIPKQLKLWFGDEYIFTKLRNLGWKIMQAELTAYHYGSLSIMSNPRSMRIIKEDKKAWEKLKI